MRRGSDTTTSCALCFSLSHQTLAHFIQDICINRSQGGEYAPKLCPSQTPVPFAITQPLFCNRPHRATQRFAHAESLHRAKGRTRGLQRVGPTAKPLALKVHMLTLLCASHRAGPPARTHIHPTPLPPQHSLPLHCHPLPSSPFRTSTVES